MATQPKRNKATAPSRNKREGGGGSKTKKSSRSKKAEPARTPTEDAPAERQGMPMRAQRRGTQKLHDRDLTAAESAKRQEREAKRREDEVAAQEKHRDEREPKGWGGLRSRRGR